MGRRDEPAFPRPISVAPNYEIEWAHRGLTIREEAILRAMQGLCANPAIVDGTPHYHRIVSDMAVEIVDAALDAMEKK